MGIANQAVQTGTLSMPHPEYSYIDLASPGRLCSAREINLFLPAGIRTCARADGGRSANQEATAAEL
jgi:hypothetical protein